MTRPDEEAAPIHGPEYPAEDTQEGPPEPRTAPEATTCPVCERIVPTPAPDICPHCQAPITTINALLETADKSITEALRDLRSGDIAKAESRLELVRATSNRHRLKTEIVQALIDRLRGDPTTALTKLNAVRERITDADLDLIKLLEEVEERTLLDQAALAQACEHYNFAVFQSRRGHFEEARRSLGMGLNLIPHHAPSHALLGKVLLAMGDEDEARYHLKRALATDPSNATATSLLTKLGESVTPNPFVWLRTRLVENPAWAGSIVVIIVLAAIALTALLSR
jgi:tetratricopeptide (TPR) repeat protein